jgi:uncharacterized membrane protein
MLPGSADATAEASAMSSYKARREFDRLGDRWAMAEPPHRHLPESSRVEAFSDSVLAIAVTLLVLDLHSDFSRGNFAHDLAAQWPAYVAYVAAFLNISAIWINHHDLFTRVRGVDARLIALNLVLLLVASLFPWPAAVISAAQRTGGRHDQITASLLYAGVGFLVPVAFIAIYTYLSRTPELLADPADTGYTRTARRRAFVSIVTYPVTSVRITAHVGNHSPCPLYSATASREQRRLRPQAPDSAARFSLSTLTG